MIKAKQVQYIKKSKDTNTMKSFFKTIINKIPPLPESVVKIEQLAKDHDATYKTIAKVLETDPILTSEILKAVNSPIYGFSREIKTLQSAISLFGIGTIRGFTLAVYIRENFNFNLKPYGITSKQFSNTAIKHHALATSWYLKSESKLFDVLSPVAFLSNVGQVLISQYLIEKNSVAEFKKALLSTVDIAIIEKEFCGTSAVQLSAEIFDHWCLDNDLICVLRYMDNPYDAPEQNIKTTQILKCIQTVIPYNGTITEKSFAEAKKLVEDYNLDMPNFLKALKNFQ